MTHHNPLFPANSDDHDEPVAQPGHYTLPIGSKIIQPISTAAQLRAAQAAQAVPGRDAAANVIRSKLDVLYAEEPAVEQELEELAHHHQPPSKHQQFLQGLQRQATSVAQIQTVWHAYYISLPEEEKHEVWREFYSEQSKHSRYAQVAQRHVEPRAEPVKAERPKPIPQPKPIPHVTEIAEVTEPVAPEQPKPAKHEPVVSTHTELSTPSAAAKRVRKRREDGRSTRDIKDSIRHNISAQSQREGKPSGLKSVMFGLSMGVAALGVMTFGLFNEMVVAPFIQPSRNVSATPIILTNDSVVASGGPKVIIPKINVEIPVDYTVESLEEDIIQKGLEDGVVHYPVTSLPGEQGNVALFGHSSNNIFNPGKYKFAFVLLSRLQDGDMFYLTYEDQVYAYRVFKQQIVAPSDTWVLDAVEGKRATVALITCDPPGTTINRLVVWGEQVSPDPSGARSSSATTTSSPTASESEAADLPGPAQSLWNRLTGWMF